MKKNLFLDLVLELGVLIFYTFSIFLFLGIIEKQILLIVLSSIVICLILFLKYLYQFYLIMDKKYRKSKTICYIITTFALPILTAFTLIILLYYYNFCYENNIVSISMTVIGILWLLAEFICNVIFNISLTKNEID